MFYAVGKFFCFLFSLLYFPLNVKGRERIPAKGGFVIASNHVSYLDPIIVGLACPRPCHYLARNTLFNNPVFGWVLRHVNAIPLKRRETDIGAIREALKFLNAGRGLILFPEGTRRIDDSIGKGLAGAGFLARKSGVPVIAAYVEGSQMAWPKGAKHPRRSPVRVIFDEPVTFDDKSGLTDEEITAHVMRRIASLKGSPAPAG